MHNGTDFPIHFPLRKLDRDVRTADLLAPERQHASGTLPFWQILYRCYDRDRHPLYIGISSNHATRLNDHRKHSVWWPLAEYIAVSVYRTAEAAKEAERAAIQSEQPQFNRQSLRGVATAKVPLHGAPELAAAVLFREATPDFIRSLAALLGHPELFPQPSPPPAARFASEQP